MPLPTTKLSATGFHFLLSLFIFALFVLSLRSFWYPEPYFTASGGWQGLKIVAFIDLILGPLLTFVIFNINKPKKELQIDLSIIFVLQISALIWGINTVYNQRPVAITFWENSFYTVPYSAISQKYSNSEHLNNLEKNPLKYYYIHKPISVDGINQLTSDVLTKKLPPFQLIDRYKPIYKHFDNIKTHSIDIKEVITANKGMKNKLIGLLSASKSNIQDNIYIPLISRYQNIILVFTQDGTLLGSIKAPFKTNI